MVNWNFLETFSILSENLSFSQTAVVLNTSQPVISRQIATLESSLGYPLFIRSKKSVRLSEQGTLLKAKLNPLFEEMTNLLLQNETPLDLFDTTIRFSSMFEAGQIILMPKLKQLIAKHTKLKFHFQLSSSADINEAVLQGKTDFGFVHTASDRKSLTKVCIATDTPILVGPNHFDKKWQEKAEFNLVGYRENDIYMENFLQKNLSKNLRAKMSIKFSINSHNEIIDLVRASSNTIAVLPLSSANIALQKNQIKILLQAKSPQELYLITHHQTLEDKRKRAFFDALTKLF